MDLNKVFASHPSSNDAGLPQSQTLATKQGGLNFKGKFSGIFQKMGDEFERMQRDQNMRNKAYDLFVNCNDHPLNVVTHYCRRDKFFACKACIAEKEITHSGVLKDGKELSDHTKMLIDEIMSLQERIKTTLPKLNKIWKRQYDRDNQKKQLPFYGDQIHDAFQEASKILTGCITDEEQRKTIKQYDLDAEYKDPMIFESEIISDMEV